MKRILSSWEGKATELGGVLIMGVLCCASQATAAIITPPGPPVYIAAPVHKRINVQGKLTDSSGQPISGSNMTVTFRLYKNISDSIAGAIWTETQAMDLPNGNFNVALGATSPSLDA